MNKYLVFLESFTKRKTIKNFLPSNYEIFATGGHLTEIEKSGFYNLGVDLVKFVPQYRLLPERSKNVKYWQSYLKNNKSGLILLATDPDREGEAIAQEVIKILNLQSHQYKRLLFYEITQQSIQQSLNSLLPLNQKLVEAQNARQVLDRMIGFCLSPLLQKKLNALSAGRVQSVVLKMIVDREIAIQEYEKKKEFILQGIYEVKRPDNKIEKYTLRQKDPQGKLVIYSDRTEAEKVKSELGPIFSLVNEEVEERFIFAKIPLTTSLLLYEARSQLNFSIAQTTRLVQQLYEGIWLANKKKQVGLVTYPRTDSRRLNKNFIQQAYTYIQNKWNKEYCQFTLQHQVENKSLSVQGAHEAIRPTYFSYHPIEIKNSLSPEQFALYNLIYQHTLASLMSPARIKNVTYTFRNKNYYFTLNEKIPTFAGFFILNPEYYLSHYKIKEFSCLEKEILTSLKVDKIEIKEYLENKPQRYNEGSLVQELERLGIGRPSTYNTFSSTLLKRNYVVYNNDKQKHFVPVQLGFEVNAFLQENFASLINEKYTADLEIELDKISRGEVSYFDFIQNFWNNFSTEWQRVSQKSNLN